MHARTRESGRSASGFVCPSLRQVTWAPRVLGALLLLLSARSATADVIVFDNAAGAFQWIGGDAGCPPGTTLDITRAPHQQDGGSNLFTFESCATDDCFAVRAANILGPGIARGASGAQGGAAPCFPETVGPLARFFAPGQSVGPDSEWLTAAAWGYRAYTGSHPFIEAGAYVGVRIRINTRWHYGWIKWPAQAWAYETKPDTAITIPVPPPCPGGVVIFENTAQVYEWIGGNAGCPPGNTLDITRAPDQQAGGSNLFSYDDCPALSSCTPQRLDIRGPGIVRASAIWAVQCGENVLWANAPRAFNPGETIGPDNSWSTSASWAFGRGGAVIPRVPTGAYFGVRISLEGRWHYGWIRWRDQAWAYATTPDTCISIPYPYCPADTNFDGVVNSQDFFDFLTDFLAGDPAADFNHDSTVNSQDFFDFLTAFFGPC